LRAEGGAPCPPATRLNNDADADSSQEQKIEKLENLYCTAPVRKIMPARRGHQFTRARLFPRQR
jgi:hypothetical protein